jgi:hypothetical protein
MPQTPEQLYEIAYKNHYTSKNIDDALIVYQQIIREYPDSPESGYAKTQIANIEKMSPEEKEKRSIKSPELSVSVPIEHTEKKAVEYRPLEETSGMASAFNVLGVLALIGGVICAFIFWPDSSGLDIGYSYKPIAYIPSVAWLISGIISSMTFFAFGKMIDNQAKIKHQLDYLIKR